VILSILDYLLRCHLGGVGRALSGPLKANRAGAGPGNGVPLLVGDSNDGIVEGGVNISPRVRHVLLFSPPASPTPTFGHEISSIYSKFRLFLEPCPAAAWHSPAGTALGARIGACALATDWQIATMAQAAITLDLLQPLDIHLNFTPQIAFDLEIPVNHLTQPGHFVLRQISDPRVRAHFRLPEDILAALKANSIDVSQRDLNPLVSW
jgi:hypothetical protein